MSYIDRNLVPDERIIFRTRKHKILFFWPVVLTVLAFYATPYLHNDPILVKVEYTPWIVVALIWGYYGLLYLTSEFAITNKRVMMREGFFYRHANEVRLTTMSQVNVDQSLLGQVLNYGEVSINAFGAFDAYPMIARPFVFQKMVNEQLDRLVNTR